MSFFDWLFDGQHRQSREQDLDAELAQWRIAETRLKAVVSWREFVSVALMAGRPRAKATMTA